MERGNRKSRVGVVVSNKMTRPSSSRVERRVARPEVREVRDEGREVQGARREAGSARSATGSAIVETRPMSKDKRWRVAAILEKAAEV